MDFSLFVFKGDIASQNEAVLKSAWHVWVSGSVVHHESLDESSVSRQFVLHVHDLNHMEIDVSFLFNAFNSIDNDVSQWVSNLRMDFSLEGSFSNR